jgi:hypothetical protein
VSRIVQKQIDLVETNGKEPEFAMRDAKREIDLALSGAIENK